MNSIVISGRLTRRPELKQTTTNKYMADFSIAVNRGIKNDDGVYEVDFINCRCWNKTAENLCRYQDKGDYILVEGSIRYGTYTDKDGKERHTTYVLANSIEWTSKKNEKQETQSNWDSAKDIEIPQEDLPFYG